MPFDDGDDLTRKPFQHMRKYGQSYQQQLQFSPQSSYSSCHVLYNVVRLFYWYHLNRKTLTMSPHLYFWLFCYSAGKSYSIPLLEWQLNDPILPFFLCEKNCRQSRFHVQWINCHCQNVTTKKSIFPNIAIHKKSREMILKVENHS